MPNVAWKTNYINESKETDIGCKITYNDGTSTSANRVRGFVSAIVGGSYNIDKACVSSSDFEIGTMIADELNMQVFLNEDKEIEWTYNSTTITVSDLTKLVGGYIYLEHYIGNTATTLYKFYIDDISYESLNVLNIHGYTDIIQLDKIVDSDTVNEQLPITLKQLFQWCFTECGLSAPTVPNDAPNQNQSITNDLTLPDECTYRQVACWCLGLMNCSLVNWQGANTVVKIKPETDEDTDEIITTHKLTDGQTFTRGLNAQEITITGIRYTFDDGTEYFNGIEGYVLEFANNPIIEANNTFKVCYDAFIGLNYATCELETINMPFIVPTDWIKVNGSYCYITHTNVSFNTHSTMDSSGESGIIKGLSPNVIDSNTVSKIIRNSMEEVSESVLEEAQENATELINNSLSGYVVVKDTNDDGHPDEILIMDSQDTSTATKVWRWNQNGLGYATSYAGPYGLAMTADGQIVADKITTGTLSADRVNGGTLSGSAINIGNGVFQVNTSGQVSASNINITGGSINMSGGQTTDKIVLTANNGSGKQVSMQPYGIKVADTDDNYHIQTQAGAIFGKDRDNNRFVLSTGQYGNTGGYLQLTNSSNQLKVNLVADYITNFDYIVNYGTTTVTVPATTYYSAFNVTWVWRIYNSGRKECFACFNIIESNYSSINNFYLYYIDNLTFPFTFTAYPCVTYSGQVGNQIAINCGTFNLNYSKVELVLMSNGSGNQSVTYRVRAEGY